MTKEEWITAATTQLQPYDLPDTRAYAESLYQTYVEDDGDVWPNDPLGAVEEDLSYWGD